MAAVSSPLLETSINGATGVLVNVTGSSQLTLDDVETAASIVQENANPDANIIFGATVCDSFEDEMRVTVIATGFDPRPEVMMPIVTPSAATTEETATEGEPAAKPVDVSDVDAFFDLFKR
jgi:cell division protein FtsZ